MIALDHRMDVQREEPAAAGDTNLPIILSILTSSFEFDITSGLA
ncbi:MAG: hypothetical protein ACM3Z4_01245 [Hyphomicrobiales bacterium]